VLPADIAVKRAGDGEPVTRHARVGFLTIDLSNWFGEALLRGALERSRLLDLDLLVVDGGTLNNRYEWESQRNHLYTMIEREMVDALLISNIFGQVSNAEGARFLERFSGIPIVTMSEKFPGIPAVRIDNAVGFRKLVTHLIDRCGSRRFAVIAGPSDDFDSNQRLAVLRSQLERRRIPFPPESVHFGDFSDPSARDGIRVLLDDRQVRFDTLVCLNDLMAIAAMEELTQRGHSIPADVKVTGFDNTYDSVFVNPPLTTVDNPAGALAAAAVDVLHGLLRGKSVRELTVLPTAFVPRLSCGETFLPEPMKAAGKARTAKRQPGRRSPRPPERILRHVAAHALRGFASRIPGRQRSWFRKTFHELVTRVFEEHDGAPREFMEKRIFSREEHEWSVEPWLVAFQALDHLCTAQGLCDDARQRSALSELIDVTRAFRNACFARDQLGLQRKEKLLFQLGEALLSGFDLALIGPALERFAGQVGLDTCFVAVFTDPSRDRARLLVSLEQGRLAAPPQDGEFPAALLLPGELLARHSPLMLDALHVREEVLGYFFINAGDHPGVLYESLRHQLSTAIKGAQLMSAVRSYSVGLERMVEERTRTLAQVNLDLTAEIGRRELAERELLKRRHLDSLSLLAGGIAHDFNNILSVILGSLSLLQENEGDEADRRSSYELMMKAVGNARGLTHQLLTFAKGGTPIKKAMELIPLIEEMALFMLHGSTVKPVFDFLDEKLVVEMDHHQISQVLNNVILNAVQAMPDGGTLTFRVRRCDPPAASQDGPLEESVLVSIADTGQGIPAEFIDRIFDPYFTTRRAGSGLGLSTSLAIIRRHGGEIRVASAPGKGTEFEIRLPLSKRQVAPVIEADVRRIPGGLSVLVLEDDERVANIFARFLGELGERYRITKDGEEAVRLHREARERGTPYDFIITDLTIPGGIGGAEVVRRIREADATVKAIVTSGYFDAPVLAEYEKYGFRAILRKPFSLDDFKVAMVTVLGLGG
jgi:signal transduction histidine kinase/DNA-binding LacI/PurR family transcriptional regulator/ActR/RegA family two-component response regulator